MPDFTGVTFANQTVTPADDALVRRALLGDGILTGCEFSYSGYTLTMRSGALIVCGRQIRHPSAQNWAVVGAKTGYARLVLDIDLTKSSTAQLFDQVTTSLEYASAEDGFTALTQENINVSGSHYQIALCVVSLGEAGITGIVSQLDAAEGGGGGNFSVVGGLTQPTSPKDNMIWVEADVKKAPKYIFAEAAPEAPFEGLIWFSATGDGIITQANVYSDGAWNRVNAYMYLSGAWVHITSTIVYLYNKGDTCDAVSGGWEAAQWYINSGTTGSAPGLTYGNSSLAVRYTGDTGLVDTRAPVNLDKIRKVCAVISGNASSNSRLAVATSGGAYGFPSSGKASKSLFNGTVELDVSALSGNYFVGFQVHGDFRVEAVWLSY